MNATDDDAGPAPIAGATVRQSIQARVRIVLLLVLMSVAAHAHAFIDPVVIVPAQPVAGQPVAFSVRIGVCEYFQAFGPRDGVTIFATDEWRTLVIDGNTLRVTARTFFAPDQPACVYPTARFQFSLGNLPPGLYRLELYGEEIFNPAFRPLIGSAQFVVGAPPASIPVNHWAILVLLAAMLAVAGMARLRLP